MVTNLGRPLRDWLGEKLITEATAASGKDPVLVKSVVHEVLADRPILEWLAHLDWQKLIQLILTLLALLPK